MDCGGTTLYALPGRAYRRGGDGPRWASLDMRTSGGRGENPVEGHNSQQFGLGCLALPAALGVAAGKLLISKHFHRFDLGVQCLGALALKVDVVAPLGACEYHSIGLAHYQIITQIGAFPGIDSGNVPRNLQIRPRDRCAPALPSTIPSSLARFLFLETGAFPGLTQSWRPIQSNLPLPE